MIKRGDERSPCVKLLWNVLQTLNSERVHLSLIIGKVQLGFYTEPGVTPTRQTNELFKNLAVLPSECNFRVLLGAGSQYTTWRRRRRRKRHQPLSGLQMNKPKPLCFYLVRVRVQHMMRLEAVFYDACKDISAIGNTFLWQIKTKRRRFWQSRVVRKRKMFTERCWCHWILQPISSGSRHWWNHPVGSSQCFWTTCPHLQEKTTLQPVGADSLYKQLAK